MKSRFIPTEICNKYAELLASNTDRSNGKQLQTTKLRKLDLIALPSKLELLESER